MSTSNCLFCRIIAGAISAEKIYEDSECFAFLDINPVNIGHTLLVPKEHYANLYETPDDLLAHMAPVVKKLAIAIKASTQADGINIAINNDPAAGQLVFHAHIHVIPRRTSEGGMHWKGIRKYEEGEMVNTGEMIRNELN